MREGRPFEDLEPSMCNYAEEVEDTDGDVNILELAKKFAILNEQKKQLEKQLDNVKDSMKVISEALCDKMVLENPNIKVKACETAEGKPIFKTVYVKSTIWAGFNPEQENGKEKLVEAMKNCGLGDMVNETFNTQSLSAYVRGLDPDVKAIDKLSDLLPEAMRPFIKLTKVINLAVK